MISLLRLLKTVRTQPLRSAFVFLALVLVIIGLWLTERPTHPLWGTYYQPHADDRTLILSSSTSYQQSFLSEYQYLSGFVIVLAPDNYAARRDQLNITISQNDNQVTYTTPLNLTTPTGLLHISLPPHKVSPSQPVILALSLPNSDQTIGLRYQPDSRKLPGGQLQVIEQQAAKNRQGHLAFRPQYQTTPRELADLALSSWLTLVAASLLAIILLKTLSKKQPPSTKIKPTRNAYIIPLVIILFTGLFIWLHFLPANHLPTNGDTTKDTIYLQSIASTIATGQIPHWLHATCGGQPLLGNPETGVLGLGTPLAVLFGAVISLKLLLALEIASAALGTYILARLFGISRLHALLPAALLAFGGYAINRILIGHTMYVGGLAFMPWIIMTGYLAFRRHPKWIIACASLITLAFFRGDTHAVAYTAMALAIISLIVAIQTRKLRPLIILFVIAALSASLSLVKILPVLEGQWHFHGHNLPELVVLLKQQDEFLPVFLDDPIQRGQLDVINGEFEDYTNIGLYTGPLPLALALLGIFVAPNRLRLIFATLLVTFLVLGEGSLYNTYLRQVPYLGQLMRLPSRLLIISILAGSILGAATLDWISHRAGRYVGPAVATTLLLVALIDMSLYAHHTLNHIEQVPPPPAIITPDYPQVISADPTQPNLHPIPLTQAGFTAPNFCQDFNRQPPFSIQTTQPLAIDSQNQSLPATISSNSITITTNNTDPIYVHTWNSPLLTVTNGFVAPHEEQIGPLTIIPTGNPVTLNYRSHTALPGALLSIGFLLLALFSIKPQNPPHHLKDKVK